MSSTERVRTKDRQVPAGGLTAYSLATGNLSFSRPSDLFRYESFIDYLSSPKQFNPCTHWKLTNVPNGYAGSTLTDVFYTSGWFDTYHITDAVSAAFNAALTTQVLGKLEFQKNNNFELLNLIGELDDLIATFTLKFWKSLSYGSFNWGILPLISDLKSLKDSFDDIFGGRFLESIEKMSSQRYMTYNLSLDGVTTTKSTPWRFTGKLRLNGTFSVGLPDTSYLPLQVFIDELGVHPDLRTVWDLIPLSFVVDYFLPVGDLLESLHPRGWANFQPNFTGFYSIEGKLTTSVNYGTISKGTAPIHVDIYKRGVLKNFNLVPDPKVDFKFDLSLRQLFNLGYLANKFRV